jgi:purine-binding chemotaxis protein CheW
MVQAAETTESYILFVVAGTTYALRSGDVLHIEMVDHVTRVPNAAPFVDGVVFSRGQVVPAVNLRARFGFDRIPYEPRSRLIVVHYRGRHVGLICDQGREFLRIAASAIQPPHEALAGLSTAYIAGIATIGERLIVIMNLEQLLNVAEPLGAA